MRKPSKEFWVPVSRLTANMAPDDRVDPLACVVARFCSCDAAQEEALEAFILGLELALTAIRLKCPAMEEGKKAAGERIVSL